MIVFEKITMKNFMSIGNAPLEIDYLKSKSTLVTAANGAGKSSLMTDSLVFALYGYPYRPINKPQLINSINGKGMLVEVDFKVGKTRYKVIRGMKPNVFKIFKNDKLINQDAAAKDYQKVLENNILKMNYRTFTQVVIMGSGNYVPFMKLNPAQRREFIEDVLDIKVFSVMNVILKDKVRILEEEIHDLELEMKMEIERINSQERLISTLESEKEIRVADLQSKIKKLNGDLVNIHKTLGKDKDQLEKLRTKLVSYDDALENLTKIRIDRTNIENEIDTHKNNVEFYKNTAVCPTCTQSIEDNHRHVMINTVQNHISSKNAELSTVELTIAGLMKNVEDMKKIQSDMLDLQAKMGELQTQSEAIVRLIETHQQQITEAQTNNTSVNAEKTKLKGMAKVVLEKNKKKQEKLEQQKYFEVAAILLKDSGIKTKIIRQYVPIFNKLINSFLQQLDLFVSFNLDENFNETVKSRHRDSFTYESFSEGEKQRIDLALAFTFRTIARLKNAVNVNVLILDEVLDQSLDGTGIDLFFKLIDDLEKTNLFVISHREGVEDKFARTIKLVKKNNFTVIE
jgi:DNA repair exonuclease SbcCD ATPase subunit